MFGDRWKEAEKIFYASFEAIHLAHLRPLNGAEDLLKHLSQDLGLYVAVVSNKRGPFLRKEAEHLGWTRYFNKLAGAGDATKDKPAIEHVHLALGDRAPGPETWFAGDADIDLICGRNAGCTPVLVRPAAPGEGEFPGHEPSLYFSDCAGFLAYLRQP